MDRTNRYRVSKYDTGLIAESGDGALLVQVEIKEILHEALANHAAPLCVVTGTWLGSTPRGLSVVSSLLFLISGAIVM